ncbi:MAG TPA: hypothetical protein VJ242_02775, partial [Patescibacteria group bacterium]|nr:hypothetical protein [Patescibacteria group bacterium]
MDNGAPTLPNDLEQPVASTPPAATLPPIVPPTPTTPPPSDVPEESPEPIKPKSKFTKNLPKIAGGLLAMALLIGGIVTGSSLLKQRTQVEQQAAAGGCPLQETEEDCESRGCVNDSESCVWRPATDDCGKEANPSCGGGGDGDDGGGGPSESGCSNASGCTCPPEDSTCYIIRYHCDRNDNF